MVPQVTVWHLVWTREEIIAQLPLHWAHAGCGLFPVLSGCECRHTELLGKERPSRSGQLAPSQSIWALVGVFSGSPISLGTDWGHFPDLVFLKCWAYQSSRSQLLKPFQPLSKYKWALKIFLLNIFLNTKFYWCYLFYHSYFWKQPPPPKNTNSSKQSQLSACIW